MDQSELSWERYEWVIETLTSSTIPPPPPPPHEYWRVVMFPYKQSGECWPHNEQTNIQFIITNAPVSNLTGLIIISLLLMGQRNL